MEIDSEVRGKPVYSQSWNVPLLFISPPLQRSQTRVGRASLETPPSTALGSTAPHVAAVGWGRTSPSSLQPRPACERG